MTTLPITTPSAATPCTNCACRPATALGPTGRLRCLGRRSHRPPHPPPALHPPRPGPCCRRLIPLASGGYSRYNSNMCLYDEPSSEPKLSLTQRRVTPEELTRALAAIEARKQEVARRQQAEQEAEQEYLAKTIPVDEAVQELNLEATPEEIWAEVETQREAKRSKDVSISAEKEDEHFTASYSSEAIRPIASVSLPVSAQKNTLAPGLVFASVLTALAFGLAVPLAFHRDHFHKATVNQFAQTSPSIYNAANFPDKIPFRLFSPDAVALLSGTNPATISVAPEASLAFEPPSQSWEFIKYEGHLYLRGIVAAPPVGEGFSHHFLELYNMSRPEIGLRPALVTLRLDHFLFCNYYQRIGMLGDSVSTISGMDEKIVISDVQLDQHAWELSKAVMSTNKPFMPANFYAPSQATESLMAIARTASNRFVGDQNAPLLSQMADDLPFEMDENSLGPLLSGVSPAKLHVQPGRILTNFPNDGGAWRLIKHNGRIYLRGWVASDAEVNRPFLHIYNFSTAKELGNSPRQISLCLDNLHYGPYGEIYSLSFEDWTGKIRKINSAGQFIAERTISNLCFPTYILMTMPGRSGSHAPTTDRRNNCTARRGTARDPGRAVSRTGSH